MGGGRGEVTTASRSLQSLKTTASANAPDKPAGTPPDTASNPQPPTLRSKSSRNSPPNRPYSQDAIPAHAGPSPPSTAPDPSPENASAKSSTATRRRTGTVPHPGPASKPTESPHTDDRTRTANPKSALRSHQPDSRQVQRKPPTLRLKDRNLQLQLPNLVPQGLRLRRHFRHSRQCRFSLHHIRPRRLRLLPKRAVRLQKRREIPSQKIQPILCFGHLIRRRISCHLDLAPNGPVRHLRLNRPHRVRVTSRRMKFRRASQILTQSLSHRPLPH